MNGVPRVNKTIIGASLLAVVLVVAATISSTSRELSSENNAGTLSHIETARTLSGALTETDSDGDGLYDWEESLWQTDPNNSDSDGDGTNDGDEVASGRDPRRAGPDDTLPENPEQEILGQVASGSEDLTLTNQLARQFFTQYLQAKKAGRAFGVASQQQLLASMLGSASAEQAIELPDYTVADFTLVTTTSDKEVHVYGNALGDAIVRNSFETENELFIMRRALDTRDQKEAERLERIASGYNGMLQDFLAMPVPESAAGRHAAFVNSIARMGMIIEGMSGVLSDPLEALLFLEQYDSATQSLRAATDNLQQYFAEQVVQFTADEPGFIFQET